MIRLSDQRVAIRHAPDARWVVIEAGSPLTVSFEAVVEVPVDAQWLE